LGELVMARRLLAAAIVALALPLPASAQFRGVAATVTPVTGPARGGSVRAALEVSLPDGFHVQSNKPNDPSLIPTVLTVDAPEGVTVHEIVFPKPIEARVLGFDQPLAVFERNFVIGVELKLPASVPAGTSVPAHLRYQACNDTTCFPPKTVDTAWTLGAGDAGAAAVLAAIPFGTGEAPGSARTSTGSATAASGGAPASAERSSADRAGVAALEGFTILGTTGGYQGASEFLRFIHNAEAGVKERGMFEGRGPLAILLLVLVGGLALNLTPCVLPMIPINLAIIGAGTKAGSRGRGFALGGVYGAAMAVVYGILGVVVILTAGTFGTINASPWFNLGIAALFVFLALAMFDIVTIDFSKFGSGIRFADAGRGTFLVAFGMGAVAALLAGACVAPVVIEVVLFSSNLYAGGTKIALALPFFLGIGMAIPWPIAGAGFASLPRPGMWMVRVKQAFGVIILVMAAYYGYEAYGIFSNRWVNAADVQASVQEKLKAGWTASLADGLATARREQKPVLIDLWATWCKNCLTMDRTTLEDPAVTGALASYVKIKFQAESPDEPPAKDVMQRFGAVGLPAYAILKPAAP
jgi:thiol:disulfide interchange protein